MPQADADRDSFARFGPRRTLAVLAAVLGLMLAGLWAGAPPPGTRGEPPQNDSALYLRVLADMRAGQSYYHAAAREQRILHYPLRPFITVRPPTLAWGLAALPDEAACQLALKALGAATMLAWVWRLRAALAAPVSFTLGMLALGASAAAAFLGDGYTFHELWCGLLISLSLALWRPGRWGASLVAGLAALSLRELAAPYLLAMAALAWRDGRRAEACAWAGGVLAFLAGLAAHAAAVHAVSNAADKVSRSWLALGGLRLTLEEMRWNGLLMLAPSWAPALAAPFVVLGLLSRRGPLADRVALTVLGYAAAFMVVGRQDNAYWGLMITPLWPVGLVWLGPALASLVSRLPVPRLRPRVEARPRPAG